MRVLCIVGIFCLASLTAADCPKKPKSKKNFNLERYFGDWYCQYAIPAIFQPSGSTCVRAQYLERGRKDGEGAFSAFYQVTNPLGLFTDFCGKAWQPDPDENPGDLQQQFPFPPTPGDLWVLDTDYKTYSVVYSCQDNLIGTTEYGWILTRKPNGTRGLKERAFRLLRNAGVDVNQFERVEHDSKCVYDMSPTCKDESYPNNPVSTVMSVLGTLTRLATRVVNGLR